MQTGLFRAKPLALLLSLMGLFVYLGFPGLPAYTHLALSILFPVAAFFLLWSGDHIEPKKLAVILPLAIFATVVWDTAAIWFHMWEFSPGSISFRIVGIPFEEYLFGLWLSIMVLGTYTSLPHFKETRRHLERHIGITALLGLVFVLQIGVILALYSNPFSYIRWLLFLAIVPSLFYVFRRGENIDEKRLALTAILMALIIIVVDLIFIPASAWRYGPETLLFPKSPALVIEDILFAVFNSVVIVGFYTSLPEKHIFTGEWK